MTTRNRCAYLTMDDPGDYVTDFELSYAPMSARGWEVETVPWRDPSIDWDRYDAAYICAPWDYPQHAEEFLRVLTKIDGSSACLVNSIELVRWNLVKTYLRDLESRGVAIVPSLWIAEIDSAQVRGWFERFGSRALVVKPDLGANAKDTFVLESPVDDERLAHVRQTFRDRSLIAQPFVDSIRTEGEYSLFFFSGALSHAILKRPQAGDFRVQEEHGAEIVRVDPSAELVETARRVLVRVDPQPVYARVDLVRGSDDRLWLMELELIEPSLYLRMDPSAAARFAAAIDRHVRAAMAE